MHTPETFRQFINAYQKSRIVLTAFELDIFSQLGNSYKTSSAIALKIHANPRATDRLMNALCAIGFLEKKNDTFCNTGFSQKYLCRSGENYMYGLMHSVNQWENWSLLTTVIREGKPASRRPDKINERGEKWLDAFIGAMHYRAYQSAAGIVSQIDLNNVKRVLDLGGGSGAYSMAFVKAAKGITATVFDLPKVVPLTQKYIKKEKLSKKIDTYAGDYLYDDFPVAYDLIFISAVIHINSPEENNAIIGKCFKSLNPGGLIIIQDHIMNEGRTTPVPGAIFAINMLVGTQHGDTYTEKEIRGWFRENKIKFEKRIFGENGNSLIIGRKNKLSF